MSETVSTDRNDDRALDEFQLKTILETAVDGIITIDFHGIIHSVNPAAERMFGHPPGELVGQNVSVLMPAPDSQQHDGYIAQYLKTGQPRIIGIGREVTGRRNDGSEFPVDLAVSEVGTGTPRLFTGIIRDISDWKIAQHQLVEAERLAAIGEAMAGLAHESRNALQRSQINVEKLARLVADQPDASELINRLQRAQDHLHLLYEEVCEYAAPVRIDATPHAIDSVLADAWAELTPLRHGRDVRLLEHHQSGTMPDDGTLVCEVDAFRIRRVFRNILDNSLSACTDPVAIDVRYSSTLLDNQPALKISIADNGPGLNHDEKQRIFEAFYSTRTRGTGLGMAMSMRVIEGHRGRLEVAPDGDAIGAELWITLSRQQCQDDSGSNR